MLLGKKIGSFRKLAMKIKVKGGSGLPEPAQQEHLLKTSGEGSNKEFKATTPTGFFAIYVGEEMTRFVVPTGYLSHPLFKMLLEKAYNDEEQKNRLVIPCSVAAFRQVVTAVECCNGMFDLEHLVEELI